MEHVNPLVSIVVRTKDRPVLLRRALASLAAQSYRPIEAVVVNDGGRDPATGELQEALADVSLRLVSLPAPTGRAHAANVGIEASAGAYIGFLDDDDELLPRHVTTLVRAATLTGERVVYSDCEMVVRELGSDLEVVMERSEGRFFLTRDFSAEVLLFENYIPLMCLLVARDALAAAVPIDESLELFEDWDFLIRLAQHNRFHRVPEVTARYVQWSTTEQIAFSGAVDGRASYLQVLGKHFTRVTPETVLAFHLAREQDALAAAARERSQRAQEERLQTLIAHLEERGRRAEASEQEARQRLGQAEQLLAAITRSLAWKLIHGYRTTVKESLLPVGTRRRRLYDRVLAAAAERTRTRPLPPSWAEHRPHAAGVPLPARHGTVEHFEPPTRVEVEAAPVMAVVSVVIPTLDAGAEIGGLLRRLRGQRGVAEVEIVAIDSGSTDGTVEACRAAGAVVAPYQGERFNHGAAREQGVARARGDLVVFLSQDALPVGDLALSRMAGFLLGDARVAAVSAREVPRSDADLFSCWQLWWFNERILAYRKDTVVGLDGRALDDLSPEQRRSAAQINNVFCCVRRRAFAEVGLRRLPFAEDLDLGLRLLERGYRLAFLPSVAVVHSHLRSPDYHLRRSFMDWSAQIDLLGFTPLDWGAQGFGSLADMVAELSHFHGRLASIAASLEVKGAPAAVKQALLHRLYAPDDGAEIASSPLSSLLTRLAAACSPADPRGDGATFRNRYAALVEDFFGFTARLASLDHREADLRASLLHLFGQLAGWCLADFLGWSAQQQRSEPALSEAATLLSAGV